MKYLAFIALLVVAGLPMLVFGQTDNTSTEFIPLTNIPNLTETGNAFSLESFLNGLFRLSIGAAAVIAVLQIMRAGIMYMGSDSGFAEKKEAKNLIALSIGGLILVLSPVVVFSIINPEILSLKIGNIEGLAVPIDPLPPAGPLPPARFITVSSAEECREKGGTVSGDGGSLLCTVPADSPAAQEETACSAFLDPTAAPTGASCARSVGDNYSRIDAQCCVGMAEEGYQCCGAIQETPPVVNTEASITIVKYGYIPIAEESQDLGSIN